MLRKDNISLLFFTNSGPLLVNKICYQYILQNINCKGQKKISRNKHTSKIETIKMFANKFS